MVIKLFQLWEISTTDQLKLLGLSSKSRSLLARYSKGDSLPGSRDTLDRIGLLLAIHKELGLLYPQNPEIRYSWVKRCNKAFHDRRPLDVMKEEGILGLVSVFRYLDYYRGL